MGRPAGKSKASLVSTFRRDLITTGLAESISRFGLGTTGLPVLALRLALRKTALRVTDLRLALRATALGVTDLRLPLRATARVVFLVSFFAIVNSPLRGYWTC